jgi:FimV-like protein
VSLPDSKFILIGTAIMIIVLLSASIFYYLRRRTPGNDAPSEAGDSGSAAIAFASDDVFAEAKEATSDVFDADVNEIDFPGLDEFEHVANTEHVSMDDMDYLNQSDNINPVDVKLDLAQTYADLGDISGAVEILEEIIGESNKEGKARAQAVLDKLNSDS